MKPQKQTYYLNGDYVSADDASLPLTDLGILRGYGVFDFLRTYNGRPFHLMDHIFRFRSSAQQILLDIPYSNEEIAEIVLETLAQNPYEESYIRFVMTGGLSPNSFMPNDEPSFFVTVTPATPYPAHYYVDGLKIISTQLAREFPTVKSTNYIGAIMAMKQATAVGAKEALYVDKQNLISECTRANFMTIRGNQITLAKERTLEGITQKALLKVIAQHGEFEVVYRSLPYDELKDVEEAFFTSSTYELAPVSQVDDIVIGSGVAGSKTLHLLQQFREYAHAGNYA